MIDNLHRYPTYKDSGVSWLGAIPEHWDMERAKWLFRKADRPIRADDDVVTCFRDGTVTLRKNRRVRGFTESLKEIGYQGVRKGDLVIHVMDAFAGAAGVSDSDGKCTPVYSVCESIADAVPFYYAYIVREMARAQWITALAKGIRERSTDFRFEVFGTQVLPVPPRDEQEGIVRFLDLHRRLTRRYIRAKKRTIKLLEELKRTLIHRALTCGLDFDAPLKPYSAEALRDVPAHWEVTSLKRAATLHRGYDLPARLREPGPYPVVSSGGVVGSHSQYMVKGPGVVTGRYGSTGAIYFVESEFWPHNTSLYVSDFHGNHPRFIYYLLHVISIDAHSGKSAVPGVDRKDLHRISVAVPTVPEQREIAAFLDQQIARIDTLIRLAEAKVAAVREYHTRLVADVATGKLDVRGVLLAEQREAESLDDFDELEDMEEAEPVFDRSMRNNITFVGG